MIGLAAGASLAVGTLLAVTPAQAYESGEASGSADRQGVSQVLRTPPAPAGAPTGLGVMATAPQISPAAERVRQVAPGSSFTCSRGRLCAMVWNPVAKKWRIFDLYVCRTYSLSYWSGSGGYVNNQTPGTKASFYNQGNKVIHTSVAADAKSGYNWGPVWKIKNC
ncbi:hypothetical protein [Streptomyces bacillaris]|uniref:hypothetical protein n=1 Tax=Streptomyces bacillaris TaxID=68179 RepID=UPI0034614669